MPAITEKQRSQVRQLAIKMRNDARRQGAHAHSKLIDELLEKDDLQGLANYIIELIQQSPELMKKHGVPKPPTLGN